MQVIRLPNGRLEETFITIPGIEAEEPASLFQRLHDFLADHTQLRIVRQDVFGLVMDPIQWPDAQNGHRNGDGWPVTWILEGNGDGCPVAGIQVHAVAGATVQPIVLGGRTVGVVFEDAIARYCILGGLQPADARAPRGTQAWETFERLEEALRQAGMDFSHVYRTWFYLDDILEWYGEFNQVRDQFFCERRVFDGLVPASTGVGGSNASGTAVVADALAIRPRNPGSGVSLQAIPSPLQCPALEYGSSFSRAVELTLPGQRRLYVSGTASIAPGGLTLHKGDVGRQVAVTMDVVAAILDSRGLGWGDVIRAIGYFKHAEDAPDFGAYCHERGLPNLPVIIAKNDICRDDLLFEIEVDAARLE